MFQFFWHLELEVTNTGWETYSVYVGPEHYFVMATYSHWLRLYKLVVQALQQTYHCTDFAAALLLLYYGPIVMSLITYRYVAHCQTFG